MANRRCDMGDCVQHGDIVELYNEEGNEVFIVYVNDAPRPGMFFAIMYHPRGTANSLTSPYTDPLSVNPWYKRQSVV